jgi:hypothetical protein
MLYRKKKQLSGGDMKDAQIRQAYVEVNPSKLGHSEWRVGSYCGENVVPSLCYKAELLGRMATRFICAVKHCTSILGQGAG